MDKKDSKTDKKKKWYGFDLDGTLAEHLGWHGYGHIGDPIRPMCDLAKRLHENGAEVRIVTARIKDAKTDEESERICKPIEDWCYKHLGFCPKITCEKDSEMLVLFDDRSKQVVKNKGLLLEDVIFMAKPELEEVIRMLTRGLLDGDVQTVKLSIKKAMPILKQLSRSMADIAS